MGETNALFLVGVGATFFVRGNLKGRRGGLTNKKIPFSDRRNSDATSASRLGQRAARRIYQGEYKGIVEKTGRKRRNLGSLKEKRKDPGECLPLSLIGYSFHYIAYKHIQ